MNQNYLISMSEFLEALTEGLSEEDILFAKIMADISSQISSERIRQGFSQKKLAALLGTTQATMSKWESGEKNLSIRKLVEIACKLDMDVVVTLKPSDDYTGESQSDLPDKSYRELCNNNSRKNRIWPNRIEENISCPGNFPSLSDKERNSYDVLLYCLCDTEVKNYIRSPNFTQQVEKQRQLSQDSYINRKYPNGLSSMQDRIFLLTEKLNVKINE